MKKWVRFTVMSLRCAPFWKAFWDASIIEIRSWLLKDKYSQHQLLILGGFFALFTSHVKINEASLGTGILAWLNHQE
jgi:hypothetical protein